MLKLIKMKHWFEKRKRDIFIKNRDKLGLISRAYFKIEEINKKYRIINKDNFVLDLGAAPGGWSQYVLGITKNITAVDISNHYELKDINFLQADIFTSEWLNNLPAYDSVISDVAPNTSGNYTIDCTVSYNLCTRVLEIGQLKLKENGNLVCKIFESQYVKEFCNEAKKHFKEVKIFKPKSSRQDSKEIFIICLNFKKN